MIRAIIIGILIIRLYGSGCYSVSTEIGSFTPVAPMREDNNRSCNLLNGKIYYNVKRAYIGCFKRYEDAKRILQETQIPLRNARIEYHPIRRDDVYIVSPYLSYVKKDEMLDNLKRAYKENRVNKLLKRFPKRIRGRGYEIIDMKEAKFLPIFNIYYLREYAKRRGTKKKILVLYNGVYTLQELSKVKRVKRYIKRLSRDTIEIKIPIVVSPTAKLIIRNKRVLMEGYPNVAIIWYFGKLYISNSKFYVWDDKNNKELAREDVPDDKVLFSDYEKPRPYFLGLTGSKAIVINSLFKGLGYHSSVGTFGFSLSNTPTEGLFNSASLAMNFYIHSDMPSIRFIGNEVNKCTMGFYTSEAANSVFIGNYFHDNMIYNFDPHDYSYNLICASNIGIGAKHAHGFIVSRYVNHSIIANNISLKNHSCGIMLDRTSYDNLIYGNMTFDNGYTGISLQESPRVLILKNYSFLNKVDGISVRNSIRVEVKKNILDTNYNNGVEIFVRDIDFTPDRDFKRDPYMKAASARIVNNKIRDNLLDNIKVKNYASVLLKDNYISNRFGVNYGEDLSYFVDRIIKNEGNFKLYGLGYPYQALGSDLIKLNKEAFKEAVRIFKYLTRVGNYSAYKTLFGMYEKRGTEKGVIELLKGSFYLDKDSLTYLGYLYLKKSREEDWREDYKKEGFIYLIEAGIIGNKDVFEDLNLLRFFVKDVNYSYIEKIYQEVYKRMKKGYILDDSFYKRNGIKGNKRVKNAIILFQYRLKKAGFKSLKKYLGYMHTHYTLFNPIIERAVKVKFKDKDRLKILRNNYYRYLYKAANNDLTCKKFLQKNDFFQSQKTELADIQKDKVIKKYIPELKRLLKKVNEYRNKKISLNVILKESK